MDTGQNDNSGDVRQAQEILKRWDHKTNVANRSTALAILMGEPVLRARKEIHGEPQPPSQAQIMASLREAIRTLKTHFGRLDPDRGNELFGRQEIAEGNLDRSLTAGRKNLCIKTKQSRTQV